MEKVRYMIGDAASILEVEQHVLRYWEEELQLDIPRNEMGHRYYTDDNIKELIRVKDLKEKGYQLKAIRMYLKSEKQRSAREEAKESQMDRKTRQQEAAKQFLTMTSARELGLGEGDMPFPITGEIETSQSGENKGIKMEQFQAVMTEIVRIALENNNAALSNEVGDRILKEMNYLMRENDQMAEERYRKLDATLRGKKIKTKNIEKQERRKFLFRREKSNEE